MSAVPFRRVSAGKGLTISVQTQPVHRVGPDTTGHHEGEVDEVDVIEMTYPVVKIEAAHPGVDLQQAWPR